MAEAGVRRVCVRYAERVRAQGVRRRPTWAEAPQAGGSSALPLGAGEGTEAQGHTD